MKNRLNPHAGINFMGFNHILWKILFILKITKTMHLNSSKYRRIFIHHAYA